MTVISEITVPVPRTERHNENAIEAFRQQLINDYPEIKQLL
jgi:NitT/TauT family transport system ATP-binding protein